jgi:hypothetical protein
VTIRKTTARPTVSPMSRNQVPGVWCNARSSGRCVTLDVARCAGRGGRPDRFARTSPPGRVSSGDRRHCLPRQRRRHLTAPRASGGTRRSSAGRAAIASVRCPPGLGAGSFANSHRPGSEGTFRVGTPHQALFTRLIVDKDHLGGRVSNDFDHRAPHRQSELAGPADTFRTPLPAPPPGVSRCLGAASRRRLTRAMRQCERREQG